jgi:hypothetical protein
VYQKTRHRHPRARVDEAISVQRLLCADIVEKGILGSGLKFPSLGGELRAE